MAGPRAQGGSATDRVLLEHGPGVPLVRVPSVLAWSCVGCRAQLSAEGNGGGGGALDISSPPTRGPLTVLELCTATFYSEGTSFPCKI